MYVTSGVANITSIPTRKHADLQALIANDHPFYSIPAIASGQGNFASGTHAARPATQAAGSVYYETDTLKWFFTYTANTWTEILSPFFDAGATQGDVLYYDVAGWKRLPIGTSGFSLKSNGAGANPSWQNANPSSAFVQTTQQTVSHIADGTFSTVFTSPSIAGITAGQSIWIMAEFSVLTGYSSGTITGRIKANGTTIASVAWSNSGTTAPTWLEAFLNCPTTSSQKGKQMNGGTAGTGIGFSTSAAAVGSPFTFTFEMAETSTGSPAQTYNLDFAQCYIFN